MIHRDQSASAAPWRAMTESLAALEWPVRARRRAAFAYFALFLAAVSLLAGFLSWYRPASSPYFVPIWITDYESPLIPRVPNAFQDSQAILKGGFFPRTSPTARSRQSSADLDREIDGLEFLAAADTALVYVCGATICNAEGKIAILPSDARLDQPQKWIPLRRVLDALQRCPARGKLLILDIFATPPADATLVYPDDVAWRVDAELAQVVDSHRLVLCTCSAGEIPLGSEALGRSVFGMFLERGLAGEADGFGKRGRKDRRVTIQELAPYVIDRVEQWARTHRNARQAPRLVASDSMLDFPLVAIRPGSPPLISAPEPKAYPDWLRDGWIWRDTLREGEFQHDSVNILRRVEAILLRAEGDWRGGYDPGQIEARTVDKLNACRRVLDARAKAPAPRPVSLAQEIAAGRSPDAKALDPLNAALAQLDEAIESAKPEELPAARAKITSDLVKSLAGFDDVTLAWAIWQAALGDTRPARLIFLRGVLEPRQPAPRYIETLWLSRLAGPSSAAPAAAESPWPADVLANLAQCVNLGEAANVRPRSIAWVRSAFDTAAQLRHDAEALAIDPGYASLDRVRRELDRSRAHLNALRESQSDIESARELVERSLATLGSLLPGLDRHPDRVGSWRRTLRATQHVFDELDRLLASNADRPAASENLNRAVRWLAEQLAPLGEAFAHETVDRLAAIASDARADGSAITAIGDTLSTALPRGHDRIKLWDALQSLSRKIDLDEEGPTMEASNVPPDAPARRSPHEIAELRRLFSTELLDLVGLSTAKPSSAARADRDLLEAWVGSAVSAMNTGDGWRGDRIERLAPLFAFDGLEPSPSWRLHRKEQADIWAWLAGDYHYEFLDGGRSALDAIAAEEFRRAVDIDDASSTPQKPEIDVPAKIPPMDLTRAGLTSRYVLNFAIKTTADNGSTQTDARPSLQLFNPDASWMTIDAAPASSAPPIAEGDGSGSSRQASMVIVGKARDDERRHETPPPPGFIARIRYGGRSFHARVPVALPDAPALAITLSRSPDGPDGPFGVIRLRPTASPETVYAYAENLTAGARQAAVEVHDATAAVVATTAVVTIDPRGILRLPLTYATGAKPAPIRGPLTVVVRDPGRPTAAPMVRTFPIQLRPPGDYCEVVFAQYVPADPLSGRADRLIVQVRQFETVAGPAPVVSLHLSTDRIPGFISAARGTFQITLGPAGAVATLDAEGLQFRGNPPTEGTFTLDVDRYERAFLFRTNFPADGNPVTPSPINRPAIAIRALDFAASSAGLDIRVSADHAPDDTAIELDLAANNSPRAGTQIRTTFGSPRNVSIQLVPPTPDLPPGGLALAARAEDWSVHFDTGAIEGRRQIRASVLGRDGTALATAAKTVLLEQRPATGVQILGVPIQAGKGKMLTATAIAVPPLSGTQAVDFFFGKPPQAGSLPADIKLISAGRVGSTETWSALITLPEDKLGPVDLGVRFVSRAGLSAYATTSVQVLATEPAPVGRVEGRVEEGRLPQAGLDVSLLDAQGRAVLKATSRPDGTFTFGGVPIGRYRASSVRPDAGTHALSDPFDVAVDAATSVLLDLSL
jgi:hypothetical protein